MSLHVFFVKTPLEYFAAEAIARALPEDEPKGLVLYEQPLTTLPENGFWDFRQDHLLRPLKGKQRLARLATFNRELLVQCASYFENQKALCLYIPRLKNNHSNYFVSSCISKFGREHVSLAIIPHGLADASNAKITLAKYLGMLGKSLLPFRRFVYGLKYYVFTGDAQGRDDSLVNKVYYLPGMAPERPFRPRVIELDIVGANNKLQPSGVLILGQTLVRSNMLSEANARLIREKLHYLLEQSGIDGPVDFLPHPRSEGYNEFYHDDYQLLENQGGMEALLAKRPYQMVVSHCSTGLFTARMILGNKARIVSIGFNLGELDPGITQSTLEIFSRYEVEVIDC